MARSGGKQLSRYRAALPPAPRRSGLVQFMVNQHKTDATIREIRHMAEATEALLRVMTHYVELVDAEVTE